MRRLGGTLKQWPQTLLAYFDTNGASNGDTEAVNGLVELHPRIARDSATAITTAYAACSSPENLYPDPTLKSDEPLYTWMRDFPFIRRRAAGRASLGTPLRLNSHCTRVFTLLSRPDVNIGSPRR